MDVATPSGSSMRTIGEHWSTLIVTATLRR